MSIPEISLYKVIRNTTGLTKRFGIMRYLYIVVCICLLCDTRAQFAPATLTPFDPNFPISGEELQYLYQSANAEYTARFYENRRPGRRRDRFISIFIPVFLTWYTTQIVPFDGTCEAAPDAAAQGLPCCSELSLLQCESVLINGSPVCAQLGNGITNACVYDCASSPALQTQVACEATNFCVYSMAIGLCTAPTG